MAVETLLNSAHFWIMLIGIVFLTIAITVVVTHKPKEWFLFHKIFAVAGIIFILLGLLTLSWLNFYLFHAVLGLIVFILVIIAIIGGFVAVKSKKRDKDMRKMHIWAGRIIFLLVLIVLIFGLITIIYLY